MMKLGSLLKNKYLCWAVMALSALTILGYVSSRAWECLVLFVAVAYGVNTFVHENTTVALLSALFAANFLFGCGRVKENATGSMDKTAQKLEEQANDMQKKSIEINRKAELDALNAMKEYGLKINYLDKKEMEAWEERAKEIIPILRGYTIREDLYDRVFEILKN